MVIIKKYNEGKEPVPVGKDYIIIPSPCKSNRSLHPPLGDELDADEYSMDTDGEDDDGYILSTFAQILPDSFWLTTTLQFDEMHCFPDLLLIVAT